VKFALTYDGELPSTGNGSKKTSAKNAIRKAFHPQLQELWKISPVLRQLAKAPLYPEQGISAVHPHHSFDGEVTHRPVYYDTGRVGQLASAPGQKIDLCAVVSRGSKSFLPLVRNTLNLTCALKILFLRREAAGNVYQGGDLDNRIKTLLDALSVPQFKENVDEGDTTECQIYCLLEDDSLVTGLEVRTERLLSAQSASESEVRLVIEVDVRVTDARIYNQSFLGD
jgi:hypothetical protein